jgi:uncharacterized protein YbaR (Trm112 family)
LKAFSQRAAVLIQPSRLRQVEMIDDLTLTYNKARQELITKELLDILACPKCKSKFRARVESPSQVPEPLSIHDLVEKVRNIHKGLIQTQKTLHDKISRLQTERGSLIGNRPVTSIE